MHQEPKELEGSIKRAEAAAANASGEQIMAQVDT